jgi:hypothetical protein
MGKLHHEYLVLSRRNLHRTIETIPCPPEMRICEQQTSESDHRIPEILIFLRHLELYHDWLWGNCNLSRPFSTLVTSAKLNLNTNKGGLNQAKHEQISTSLDVEQIGVNLFRSKFLWIPLRARGVYGGRSIPARPCYIILTAGTDKSSVLVSGRAA